MVFNTFSVATAVTPSVIETYFSHFLNRAPLKQKPTAHISYHEGLKLVRQFLDYASRHTVEDLQAFTAQWVPAPTWVHTSNLEIPAPYLERAAKLLQTQLGPKGIEQVGGSTWWQWRRPDAPLKAEWIEMKKDYNERKRTGGKCERVILYVHGGAYYFGSVDEHRYQIQRHARKLKARVLAPRYRLAPQFPFPCGLFDCIATYLYLLEQFDPSQILFAGDSAGGGMVLGMLVTLRDQGIALPAGTMLLSPWVDLTHSFPSVAGNGDGDYIPPHGFHHKPSMVWPPPDSDELRNVGLSSKEKKARAKAAVPPSDADLESALPGTIKHAEADLPGTIKRAETAEGNRFPASGEDLTIVLDGQTIQIKDQIQMYATNQLLAHPLVSPVQQPSLGGLPPMLIQVGGAELLADEQIYLAHKAANPKDYPPSDAVLKGYGLKREDIEKYPPTDVCLQVWDDLCHVPHTLSFTRPAKYMYRSVAQFGAWALSNAQHKNIEIIDDDAISFISSGNDTDTEASASTNDVLQTDVNGVLPANDAALKPKAKPIGSIGKAGDPIHPFRDHMIRQRVDRHGNIYPLPSTLQMACLHLDPASIGTIKPGPVRKWIAKKQETDTRFAKEKQKIQKKRAKEMAKGFDAVDSSESPPPTAIAGRRRKDMPLDKKIKKSWGLAMWSGWGSSHDENTLEREEKMEETISRQTSHATRNMDAVPEATKPASLTPEAGAKKKRRTSSVSMLTVGMPWAQKDKERPRSPYRKIADTGQTSYALPVNGVLEPGSSARSLHSRRSSRSGSTSVFASRPASQATPSERPPAANGLPPTTAAVAPDSTKVEGSENTYQSSMSSRPHNGTVAYPFKLRNPVFNPSTATLDSQAPDGTLSAAAVAGRAERPDDENGNEFDRRPSAETEPRHKRTFSDSAPELTPTIEHEPTFSEKEVVVDGPSLSVAPQKIAGRSMTPLENAQASPLEMYIPPTDPSTPKLSTQSPNGTSQPTMMPPSPVEQQREMPFRAHNAAAAVANKFHHRTSESSSPIDASRDNPFSSRAHMHNPRDLRAAILARQAQNEASEAASAKKAEGPAPIEMPAAPVPSVRSQTPPSRTESPTSPATSDTTPPQRSIANPRDLKAAMLARQAQLSASEAAHPAPVELSAVPRDPLQQRVERSVSPVRSAPSPSPEPQTQTKNSNHNYNIIMPVLESRAPIARQQASTPPPPPPPKDEPRLSKEARERSMDKGRHGEQKRSGSVPRSKHSFAPTIGDLGFERGDEKIDRRPPLESFVTANDGLDRNGHV